MRKTTKPTKLDLPKPTNGYCLCGNLGNIREHQGWVCDRCRRIESQQKAEGLRKLSSGLNRKRRHIRVEDHMYADQPI